MWRLHRVAWLGAVILACGRGSDHPPAIPDGPLGAAIQRGRALLLATRDSLPAHVGNRLRCTSCHLDEGRRATGSLVGAYARYPQYRPRSATVETIEYRVNDCFRRSMNGTPLASDGGDMRDIVAYLWFLSRDVPSGSRPPPPRREGRTGWPSGRDSGPTPRRAGDCTAPCAPSVTDRTAKARQWRLPCGGPTRTTSARGWPGSARPPRSSGTTCPSTSRARSAIRRRSTSR